MLLSTYKVTKFKQDKYYTRHQSAYKMAKETKLQFHVAGQS